MPEGTRLVARLFRGGPTAAIYLLLESGHASDLYRVDLSVFGSDTFSYYLGKATLHHYDRHTAQRRAYGDSARAVLEPRVRARPDDGFYHSFLSVAYAFMGRKADAIREGKEAERVLPLSRDANGGIVPIFFLARTYLLVDEPDSAVTQLERLLELPSTFTRASVQIDPLWAPLRGNRRFEQIIASREP